jgi:3-methyladenine DNA glycosylase AlkD
MSAESPARAAGAARAQLRRLSRPAGEFDASRYFRGTDGLGFHNVGTAAVRALARSIHHSHPQWTIDEALAFAETLIGDRYLETKGVGIELLARYRREFTPRLLPVWKRWLAQGDSDNWATTDSICGCLIGPLVAAHPALATTVASWTGHRSLWVRRAAAVGLLVYLRRSRSPELAFQVAQALHRDEEDLIQKAVGWLLREAGKIDSNRLERYLRRNGPAIPRITVRYAIERFPPARRLELLEATSSQSRSNRVR